LLNSAKLGDSSNPNMTHAHYESRSVDMCTGYTVLSIMQIIVQWLRTYTRIYEMYTFVYSILFFLHAALVLLTYLRSIKLGALFKKAAICV